MRATRAVHSAGRRTGLPQGRRGGGRERAVPDSLAACRTCATSSSARSDARGWSRIGHGVYTRDSTADQRTTALLAWQQVIPENACLTHLTAAALHGLWLPPLPGQLPVIVSQPKSEARAKRPEIVVMRHNGPVPHVRRGSLSVATVEETLLVCARDLGLLDLVVLGDSALHAGLTTPGRLSRAASRRRWGAPALRRAIPWMDGRSESAWESVLRVLHRACDVDVVPQHEVLDHEGRLVARGDLWLRGTRTLHEYDGEVHRDAFVHRKDLRRDRALLDVDWCRRGYSRPDVLHQPERILADADRALGRRHRADRLDAWLAIMAASLFDRHGPARLSARLRHGSGRSPR